MEQIQFVGLNKLEDVDQAMVKKLCEEYYGKVERLLHNKTTIKVQIKPIVKGGARQRYEVAITAMAPTRKFKANKASEQESWDLASIIHAGFKDLMHEIKHSFKE